MSKIFSDNSQTIGNTPLVRLNNVASGNVFAKIESRNPSFSVKCRIGANMVWDAEKKGTLKKGIELVEPTSGNTGIALAFVAAARGYKITLTMPNTMSVERRKLLTALGANLVLTDPEIWDATDGNIDVFVAGVGTGGTLTGVTRYLKNTQGKAIVSVAVEPSTSPVITQALAGEEIKPGPHKIQGIGAGFIPKNLDLSLIDIAKQVTNEQAIDMARRLMEEEGILAGISSGAAVFAAAELAKQPEYADKNIVVILPSSGERYLSTPLFEGVFEGENFQ